MTMFIIQSLLLLAIAFVLGCMIGALLNRMVVGAETPNLDKQTETAEAPKVEAVVEKKPEPAAKPKAKPQPQTKTRQDQAATSKTLSKAKTTQANTGKDDLKRIRGIGPQNEARLNSEGITSFAQIAGLSIKEQGELGERLSFPGRIEREEWVKQAKVLAKGQKTEFAKRVDKGEVESSQGKPAVSGVGKKPPLSEQQPASGSDDLTLIDGVGNALEKKLNAIGVYTFAQIAKWNSEQQAWIGNELGFPGRPERENWVNEAKALAKSGGAGKTKKPERGEIKTSRKARI